MKNKNTGKPFERLTKKVFDVLAANERLTTVEMDVQLEGADGARQIDVLVESKVAGLSIRTVVEARDYNKRLDITHVDGLHSKMRDVKANKAVLVSRRGFSKKATAKAKRLGITLCTLNNPATELANVGLEIPILLQDVYELQISFHGQVHLKAGTPVWYDSFQYINGIRILDYVQTAITEGRINGLENGIPMDWSPDIPAPHYIRLNESGETAQMNDYRIRLHPNVSYLFGYVSELEGSVVFQNLSQDDASLIFTWPDLSELRPQLTQFRTLEDIPSVQSTLVITGVIVPTFMPQDQQFVQGSITPVDSDDTHSYSYTIPPNAT